MQTVIIVVHLMIVAVLIGAVLLQKSGRRRSWHGRRRRLHVEPRHGEPAVADDGDPGGGFFITSLFLSWLPATTASRLDLGTPASQSRAAGGARRSRRRPGRRAGHAEEVDEQQAGPWAAAAAVAIKQVAMQGGLPSCITIPSMLDKLKFTSPTAHNSLPRHAIRFGESGSWP
jgi:preprotein translocase subunit SecG